LLETTASIPARIHPDSLFAQLDSLPREFPMHSRGMFLFLSLGLLPTVLSAPTPTLMTFTALNVHGEKANVERTWARNDRVYHLSGIIAKHIGAPDNWKANYDGAFIEDAMYSGGITRPSGRRDIIYFQVEAPGSEKCPVGSHCLGFSARGWDLQNRFKGSYMGLFKQRVPATHVAKVFNDPFDRR